MREPKQVRGTGKRAGTVVVFRNYDGVTLTAKGQRGATRARALFVGDMTDRLLELLRMGGRLNGGSCALELRIDSRGWADLIFKGPRGAWLASYELRPDALRYLRRYAREAVRG